MAQLNITAEGLTEHTKVLASPEFEGRLPASAGEVLTLGYLATAFAQAGCTPGGDKPLLAGGTTMPIHTCMHACTT